LRPATPFSPTPLCRRRHAACAQRRCAILRLRRLSSRRRLPDADDFDLFLLLPPAPPERPPSASFASMFAAACRFAASFRHFTPLSSRRCRRQPFSRRMRLITRRFLPPSVIFALPAFSASRQRRGASVPDFAIRHADVYFAARATTDHADAFSPLFRFQLDTPPRCRFRFLPLMFSDTLPA